MAVPSFVSEHLSGEGITPEAEDSIKWQAVSLYAGRPQPLHPIEYAIYSQAASVLLFLGGADTVRSSHIVSRVHDR